MPAIINNEQNININTNNINIDNSLDNSSNNIKSIIHYPMKNPNSLNNIHKRPVTAIGKNCKASKKIEVEVERSKDNKNLNNALNTLHEFQPKVVASICFNDYIDTKYRIKPESTKFKKMTFSKGKNEKVLNTVSSFEEMSLMKRDKDLNYIDKDNSNTFNRANNNNNKLNTNQSDGFKTMKKRPINKQKGGLGDLILVESYKQNL